MKHLCMIFLVCLMILTFAGAAKADTIMFPIIFEIPGQVSTIISVINGVVSINSGGVLGIGGTLTPVGALHYRYFTKQIFPEGELLDKCDEFDFCRPTSLNDVVTFDASGYIESGNAMFGDPGAGFVGGVQVSYNAGGGLPPQFNDMLTPQPRAGYLLVSHASDPASCSDITVNAPLDGDAVIIDILNGGTFSYRALQNSSTGTAFGALNSNYSFRTSDERLVEVGHSFYENTVIRPTAQAIQRYFVTPLYIHSNITGPSDNMLDAFRQKRTMISLRGWTNSSSPEPLGVFDRNENFLSGGQSVHVRCVGRVSLQDLLGAVFVNPPSALSVTGGWATVDLTPPVPIAAEGETSITGSGYDAYVYDVKIFPPDVPSPAGLIFMYDGKVIRTKNLATAHRNGVFPFMLADTLAFFDASVANGTLMGDGPGNSANGRMGALRNMLVASGNMATQGDTNGAFGQLREAYLRTDGQTMPPDFVKGPAAPQLAGMIMELMDSLGTQ